MLENLKFKLHAIVNWLFPMLEETMVLSEKHKELIQIIEMMPDTALFTKYDWCGDGRKPVAREYIFRSFIAKAVFNIPTTSQLIQQLKTDKTLRSLCGFEGINEIPSESTFSRAFADFAKDGVTQKIHEMILTATVGEHLFGHASIDATAIDAREKPKPKSKEKKEEKPKAKRKRGRPKKGEEAPKPDPTRLELQSSRTLEFNILDLPIVCEFGCKRNSKGHTTGWIGFKLHLSVVDGDIPVAAILTSASLHDGQVAIPLIQMTSERVLTLYDLMDSAYDAEHIHNFSKSVGHVPIIDSNPRRGEKTPFEPARAKRYAQRSSAERVNSALKDSYGARFLRVRGAAKAMTHLMFGIIALTAVQVVRLVS